jgi:hypothetical protein
METRAEWKREAVEKAAKDEQRKQKLQPLTAKSFTAFFYSKQPDIEEIAGKK